MNATYRELSLSGLWNNSPGLVQLLGLCRLMAFTTNVVNGLGLGPVSYTHLDVYKRQGIDCGDFLGNQPANVRVTAVSPV